MTPLAPSKAPLIFSVHPLLCPSSDNNKSFLRSDDVFDNKVTLVHTKRYLICAIIKQYGFDTMFYSF